MLTPDFVEAYGKNAPEIFKSVANAALSYDDFNCQLAKVVTCLCSGDYAKVCYYEKILNKNEFIG